MERGLVKAHPRDVAEIGQDCQAEKLDLYAGKVVESEGESDEEGPPDKKDDRIRANQGFFGVVVLIERPYFPLNGLFCQVFTISPECDGEERWYDQGQYRQYHDSSDLERRALFWLLGGGNY